MKYPSDWEKIDIQHPLPNTQGNVMFVPPEGGAVVIIVANMTKEEKPSAETHRAIINELRSNKTIEVVDSNITSSTTLDGNPASKLVVLTKPIGSEIELKTTHLLSKKATWHFLLLCITL
jgi:hypothetical protein